MTFIAPGSPTAAQGTWIGPGTGTVTSPTVGSTNGIVTPASQAVPNNGQLLVASTPNLAIGTYFTTARLTISGVTTAGPLEIWLSTATQNVATAQQLVPTDVPQSISVAGILTLTLVGPIGIYIQTNANLGGTVGAATPFNGLFSTGLQYMRIA